jgi:hypothetical protein
VAAAFGHDVYRHTCIEQAGLVRAAQLVEPQLRKAAEWLKLHGLNVTQR